MPKLKQQYMCGECGAVSPRWAGKCPNCGAWNSLELSQSDDTKSTPGRVVQLIDADDTQNFTQSPRLKCDQVALDTVLGGGIVPGSVILITGEPGIGKSTLLLQIAASIGTKNTALYASGEEAVAQVAQRANRLLVAKKSSLKLAEVDVVEDIDATLAQANFDVCIVDSIQTLRSRDVPTLPGTPTQIKHCASVLMKSAKSHKCAVIIVGHVTKGGEAAGPKLLEHLVDVVLTLDGDRFGGFKVLRSLKNRYGPTDETAIYEMTESGLQPVENPSAALLEERLTTDGSVILATLEGTRPVLVEMQALVSKSQFGFPKRTASGIDLNRMNLLISMITKRTKLNLSEYDVYVNVVGGLKLSEPASDLALCLAIASSAAGKSLGKDVVVFGEVGLSGEVRRVPRIEARVREAKRLGFKTVIGPRQSKAIPGYTSVTDIKQALAFALKNQ